MDILNYKIFLFHSILLQSDELLLYLLKSLNYYLDDNSIIKNLFDNFFNLIKKFYDIKNDFEFNQKTIAGLKQYEIVLINFYNLILQELLKNSYSDREKKLIWLLNQVINIIIELYYKIFNEELKQVL